MLRRPQDLEKEACHLGVAPHPNSNLGGRRLLGLRVLDRELRADHRAAGSLRLLEFGDQVFRSSIRRQQRCGERDECG